MMNVTIICIGKLKEKYWQDAVKEYEKRLSAFCKLQILQLDETRIPDKPTPSQIQLGVEKEGERILSKIPAGSCVIGLCIEGKQLSSEELSAFVSKQSLEGVSHLTLIIGGSYGLSDKVKSACKLKLSFSKMTFPHQLFRVLLLEQIYRAFQIEKGSPYHK
jgi:23S rRNA (pseudouridine1915-N3)-methyltransferase